MGLALLRVFAPDAPADLPLFGGGPSRRVVDPFAGSGRWLVEPCAELGLDLELWDINPHAPAVQGATDERT